MSKRVNTEDRDELVARLRREILAGRYETPEKLEAAVDAYLDETAER